MRTDESKAPLISVVIPTYRRHLSFLTRSCESVLNQSWKNLELIVVDDNPPDSEYRSEVSGYVRQLSETDRRVRYVGNEKNLGGALARNNGLDAASGAYICFLDDDDEYLPEKLSHQVRFMLDGGYDMSFTNTRIYSDSGRLTDQRSFEWLADTRNDTLLRAHLTHHITPTDAYMFRTGFLRSLGGFEDSRMGQEFYLMMRTIESGCKIGYLNCCDIRMYDHSGERISNGRNKIEGEMALYRFKQQYLPRLSPAERKYVAFRHYVVMGIAYLRNRQALNAGGQLFRALLASPVDFFREGKRYLTNVIHSRHGISQDGGEPS